MSWRGVPPCRAQRLPRRFVELVGETSKSKAGHFDPEAFEDHYERALVELIRKQAGVKITPR
jgi:DNA end-binding protein Ku